MSRIVKSLIGIAATLLMGWAYHDPLGRGESLIDGLETQAKAAVAEVPGVEAKLGREPLSRNVTLSGPADEFQREGMGQFPGLNDRVGAIEGIGRLQWADQGSAGAGIPLLLESLAMIVLAYFAGILIAFLLFGRPKKESYLS